MKMAVSVSDDLFTSVEKLACQLRVSRSHIFSEAVRDYVRRWENQRMLEEINRSCLTAETDEERNVREKSIGHYARHIKM
jgi:metal-responsive CopG/Arc/MetJ family transcriptional regulator